MATVAGVRNSAAGSERDISTLWFHYLRGTSNGIEHYSERIELSLFTRDEMTWAFGSAGVEVRYEPEGLTDRGLYVAKQCL